jgi:dephospho-CoA kinase
MKVLVFGPSGSGKTYVAKALKDAGINAFDADEIEELSNWYDQNGKIVAAPTTADEAVNNHYAFLWSKKIMAAFLAKYNDVYVFGGSGNISSVFELFDRVYFLKIEPELQRERLRSPDRPTPQMDANDDGLIVWGEWLEQFATKQNIPFVDASQTPQQIYHIISRK